MAKQNQYTAAEKLVILEELNTGLSPLMDLAQKYGISKTTLVKWRHQYKLYGYEGLEPKPHQTTYSAELKLQADLDYLSGNGSQYEIIDKYKIASRTQLHNWINKYNSHSSFKSRERGGRKAMTLLQSRKITGKIKRPQSNGFPN